jgi:UDP-N-acetylglucosamine--N-acetylmuramyl-(pentapeptide) pyrophosphoryl-undecaprenol N-acetylglucosamine transferase
MKIIVTGGHLTPALAYIEHCKKNDAEAELFFFGRTFSQSKQQQKSIEKEMVTALGIPFYSIDTPKLTSWLPWQVAIFVYEYLLSILKIMQYLIRLKPDCILSFGGYLAVPVAIIGYLLRVPIVTHEQTVTAGRANIFIGSLASKIALSYDQSKQYFPSRKVVVTGNPIRESILTPSKDKPAWLVTQSKKPILYITGGNQGSHIINTVTKQIIRQLTRDFIVIHACGRPTTTTNYEQELNLVARKLPSTHQGRYFVRTWITTEDLGWILHNACLAISRAGANSIQELTVTQVPSLLIPLPFSHNNEQMLNAKAMAETGGAVVISQKELSPELVVQTIKKMLSTHKAMKRKLKLAALPKTGAQRLHETVLEVIKK